MCGTCCRNMPCELIPDDLPILLDKFKMSFKEFFVKYLIAVPCTCGEKSDIIFRLSPVRAVNGKRYKTFIENQDYVDDVSKEGECIFLKDNKCLVHDVKPFGGRLMKCSKMTGGLTLQLTNSQYFIYWYNNQHIFYELSDEIEYEMKRIQKLYSMADSYYELYEKNEGNDSDLIKKYENCIREAEKIAEYDLKNAFDNLSVS